MAHQLVKPGFTSLTTSTLDSATVRNMIDVHGFTRGEHLEVLPMPGHRSNELIVSGPGSAGFGPPIDRLIIPGPAASTINWPEQIRNAIDIVFGGGNQLQEPVDIPIPGGVMLPDPGTPGGPIMPFPGGGSPCSRNTRVPFQVQPNGMMGCPCGYHPEKQGKPYCVRNRRMNPLNPRALSRATRRVGGFARAVQRARTIKKVCRSL